MKKNHHCKCEECGKKWAGRKRRFCSPECRKISQRRRSLKGHNCLHCKKDITGSRSRYCSDSCKDAAHTRTCEGCGGEFVRKETGNAGRFCSRACAFKNNNGKKYKPKPPKAIRICKCKQCGKMFGAKNNRRTLCSHGCKKAFARAAAMKSRMDNGRICCFCGSIISTERMIEKPWVKTCCNDCDNAIMDRAKDRSNAAKKARRARIRGSVSVYVLPAKIFKRDKWTCQICGVKTPKKLRGTFKDNAPELDHVVPVAKGGAHVPHNLQCLCRKCNQAKSDSLIGQLTMSI